MALAEKPRKSTATAPYVLRRNLINRRSPRTLIEGPSDEIPPYRGTFALSIRPAICAITDSRSLRAERDERSNLLRDARKLSQRLSIILIWPLRKHLSVIKAFMRKTRRIC